jgi:Ca2+-binding EF-hand superfamily protein
MACSAVKYRVYAWAKRIWHRIADEESCNFVKLRNFFLPPLFVSVNYRSITMKYSIALLSLISLVAAQAQSPAPQSPTGPGKNRPPAGGDKMRVLEFWRKVDANQDQKIAMEEFRQLQRISQLPADKQEKLFGHLDKDKNGSLDGAELRPQNGGPGSPGAGGTTPGNPGGPQDGRKRAFPRIAELDTNGDKKISLDEFVASPMIAKLPEERQKKIFGNMDRNGDGSLSPEDGPATGANRRPDGSGPGNADGSKRPNGPEANKKRPGAPQAPNGQAGLEPRGFPAMDMNKDSFVDFSEFQKSPMGHGKTEDAQEDVFEVIDANDDLKFDHDELKTYWEMQKNAPKPGAPKPDRPKKGPAPKGETDEMNPADADEMMMEGA